MTNPATLGLLPDGLCSFPIIPLFQRDGCESFPSELDLKAHDTVFVPEGGAVLRR